MVMKSFGIRGPGKNGANKLRGGDDSSMIDSIGSGRLNSDSENNDQQSNTIMQQIKNFSLTPMNDEIA